MSRNRLRRTLAGTTTAALAATALLAAAPASGQVATARAGDPAASAAGRFAEVIAAGGLDRPDRAPLAARPQRNPAEPRTDGRTGQALDTASSAAPGLPATLRIAGTDRVLTAIAASQDVFADAGTAYDASSVVLARSDDFADALAGIPLAAAEDGPLLLTRGNKLDPRVAAEIQRTLPAGGTVYILGGTNVMSTTLTGTLRQLGYKLVRYSGADRYATAVDVAERGLGSPPLSFVTTGRSFADALSAGNAAGVLGGAVLLTRDGTMPGVGASYLKSLDTRYPADPAHPGMPGHASAIVGGPAKGTWDTDVVVVGNDRWGTSAQLASFVTDVIAFGPDPYETTYAGLANGTGFADALSGGAHAAVLGAPLLLTRQANLPGPTSAALSAYVPQLQQVWIYGSEVVVSGAVVTQLEELLTP